MKVGTKQFFWKVADFVNTPKQQAKPFNIIPGQDGKLYEVYDNPLGRMVRPLTHVKELDPIQPGFQLNLPKIPGNLLQMIISFFRTYSTQNIKSEVMAEVYWDSKCHRYLIHIPTQSVSRNFVVSDSEIKYDPRYLQVMQIHSHNTMRAYFSKVDDADEVSYMLYGVVGLLDQEIPDIKFRIGRAGTFFELPLDYLFDNTDIQTIVDYPSEWHLKVQVIQDNNKLEDKDGKSNQITANQSDIL